MKKFKPILPDMTRPKLHALFNAQGNPATDEEIRSAAMAVCLRDMTKAPVMSAPAVTRTFLVARMADMPCEVFACLFLDNRHRLIEYHELFRGTIDGSSVHPREVVSEALRVNAAAVIFAHNHPSGVSEQSHADELITKQLRDALALVDIRVLDHVIVGASSTLSFAERGLL